MSASTHKYIRNNGLEINIEKLSVIFLFVYIVLPQYFGMDTPFFDLTAQRIMVIIMFLVIIRDKNSSKAFLAYILKNKMFIGICLFLGVAFYTFVFRHHIGTFVYPVIEFLAMYILIYVVKDVLGIERTINIICKFAYLLCILGFVEYIMKRSPFSYLETIHGLYTGASFRSGSYRIMGPANHSLAYGLILITFLPFATIDYSNDEIYLFHKWPLLLLLLGNVFLNGSRSTLAVFIAEICVIVLLTSKSKKKRTFLFLFISITLFAIFEIIIYKTNLGQTIMLQITSVIDEIFGTEYAVKYGADVITLKNSSDYRKYLPQIFTLSFLNPLIGRGSGYVFAWYTGEYTIQSVDNFYVALYIRYAYPGMISYIGFIITAIVEMIRNAIKSKSGICCGLFIGVVFYFLNLWWLDTLQTIKYVYIIIGIFWVWYEKNSDFNIHKK